MNEQEQAATTQEQRLPFDQEACQILRQAAGLIFTRSPEVRSIAAVIDYYGSLNDAQVQKGIWVSDHGVVDTPDAVMGSAFQVIGLMEQILARAIGFAESLREDVHTLSQENLRLQTINEQLRKEIGTIEDAQADLDADPSGDEA